MQQNCKKMKRLEWKCVDEIPLLCVTSLVQWCLVTVHNLLIVDINIYLINYYNLEISNI